MKCTPSIKIHEYRISEEEKRLNSIIYSLNSMDYDATGARAVVKIIEEQGVDKFNFKYPYDSFEEFKKHTLAGEFDVDIASVLVTPEEDEEFRKAVEEDRACTRH